MTLKIIHKKNSVPATLWCMGNRNEDIKTTLIVLLSTDIPAQLFTVSVISLFFHKIYIFYSELYTVTFFMLLYLS